MNCKHNFSNEYCKLKKGLTENLFCDDCDEKEESRQFETGAFRNSAKGKGRCDLLPPRALLRLARHFEKGCDRYGDRNWEKGIPINSFIDSSLRHIMQYMIGQTNEDHLAAAAWNLVCAMELEEKLGYKFDRGEED